MKKLKVLALLVAVTITSCGTITQMPNPTTSYQGTKPSQGQPAREIKTGALVADLFMGVWPLVIDFATCQIYREAPKKK